MTRWARAVVVAALLGGSGCCHHCGLCDRWDGRNPPSGMRLDEGPPPLPSQALPPAGAVPGPRAGTGAYGGS
jgi:hypothetical protein